MIIHGYDFPDPPKAARIALQLGSIDPDGDAQSAYVRILERGYDQRLSAPMTWLWRMISQIVIDSRKAHYVARSVVLNSKHDQLHDHERDVSYVIETHETAALAMALCNGTGYIMTMLADGKSYKDIARLTRLPIGTVKSKVSRARQRCYDGGLL